MVVLSEDLQESGCLKIGNPGSVGLEFAKQGHFLIDQLFSLRGKLCPNHKVSGDLPVRRLNGSNITQQTQEMRPQAKVARVGQGRATTMRRGVMRVHSLLIVRQVLAFSMLSQRATPFSLVFGRWRLSLAMVQTGCATSFPTLLARALLSGGRGTGETRRRSIGQMGLRQWCGWASRIFRFRSTYRGSQSHADPFRREGCAWSRRLPTFYVRRGLHDWRRRPSRVYACRDDELPMIVLAS